MKKTAEGKYLKKDASNYDKDAYEKPSVTVDVAICTIMDDDLKVLLIKRKYEPFKNHWAIPGGFVDLKKKESLEETAFRELEEETNLDGIYLEQLKTYGDPDRDPRMRIITVAYFALLPYENLTSKEIKADDDAKEVKWFSLRHLPKNLGFDHKKILNDLLIRLIGKASYTPIVFSLVPKKFTWLRLHKAYEIVLGRKLIPSNFRRKIKSMYDLKILKNKKRPASRGRPSVYLQYEGMKEF
jgi:8-oxo-dGTP diphosphatase